MLKLERVNFQYNNTVLTKSGQRKMVLIFEDPFFFSFPCNGDPAFCKESLILIPMAKKKLIRFEAIRSFPNVLQYPEGMAGQWHIFFKNRNPLTLELGCGRGEYTFALASRYADKNFIGVDLKGNRIYTGAKKCLEENISNAAFLRTQIGKINDYFSAGEVREIWITFPDPQLRNSRAKKRLTHPRFLRLYQQILSKGGLIHLKTDSPDLYKFTLVVISMYDLTLLESSDNLYARPLTKDVLGIKTHYENLDIAKSSRIHYLCFSLPGRPLPEIDEILQQSIKASETAIS
jgi:tRNA (guanine-N7-)-methyltransferase